MYVYTYIYIEIYRGTERAGDRVPAISDVKNIYIHKFINSYTHKYIHTYIHRYKHTYGHIHMTSTCISTHTFCFDTVMYDF